MNYKEFQMIPVSDMKVDSSYQRQPDGKRVEKIASNWDDRKANLIHISHRPDGYYVIDGNHTRLAYMKNGGDELPCRVYENLSVDEEAKLFYELNDSQKKPTFGEILKAKAAAGCEIEKTYIQLLDESGISYIFRGKSNCEIKCHYALINVYKMTTYHLMARALSVAKKAADGRNDFYRIGFFPGLCSLVVLHPDVDDTRLIQMVRGVTASQVREKAEAHRHAMISCSQSATRDYRKAYIDIYNKGLRKNKIEEQ